MGLRARVQDVFRRRGYEVVRYPLRRILAQAGVTVVLDVGANAGQFGRELRALGYSGRIVSFEPLPAAFAALAAQCARDGAWDAVPLALGAAPGTLPLNVSATDASSSLLPMLPAHEASAPGSGYTGTVDVTVETLDRVFDRHCQPGDVVFLKVDTQGFEREVLAGAEASLGRVAGLQLELSFTPLYDGAPLAEELMATARAHGFTPVWLMHGFKDAATQHLLQADGVFLRA